MQKTNSLISHRQFYSGHLAQAVILYFERKTPERAWHLAQAAGRAGLFGVAFLNVLDSLMDSSNSSDDCISGAKDILSVPEAGASKPRSETAEEFLQLVFQFLPSVKIREVIEDYLEDLDERVSEEWGEEDDAIIIYHTRVVSGFHWLCERVMDDEKILPLFVRDLDAFGSMICEANETIRLQLHSFLGGIPIASFLRRGVVKDWLTDNFVFLSDEFLNLKGPEFVLPLPEKAADAPILVSAGMIREPEKPFWKEGLKKWLDGRKGIIDPFIAANVSSEPYEFPVERRLGMVAMGAKRKRALPPALETNWIALDIIMPRDRERVKLLPPESPSGEELKKLKSILAYISQFDAYYYAIRGEVEGVTVYSCKAEPVPTSRTRVVVKDIPPETRLLIIGLHEDPDVLNQVMRGVLSNEDLRKKGESEIFFLFYLPAEDK